MGFDHVGIILKAGATGAAGRECSGERQDRAVVSVVEGVWRVKN